MNLSTTARISAITTKLSLRGGDDRRFADWQAAFTRAVTGFAGFLSIEIIPAFPGASDWRIVQRFHTPQQLASWRKAGERARLIADVAPLLAAGSTVSDEEAAPDFHSLNTVTEVITTDIKPGQDEPFRAWCEARNLALEDDEDATFSNFAWVRQAWEEQRAVMGSNPWRFGIKGNEKTLEAQIRYAGEQGLLARKIGIEDLYIRMDEV